MYPSPITKKSSCHDNNNSSSISQSQSRHIWLPTWDSSFGSAAPAWPVPGLCCLLLVGQNHQLLAWKCVSSSAHALSVDPKFHGKSVHHVSLSHKMPQHKLPRKQFLARFQRQRFAQTWRLRCALAGITWLDHFDVKVSASACILTSEFCA